MHAPGISLTVFSARVTIHPSLQNNNRTILLNVGAFTVLVAIIDYGLGNVASIGNGFARMGFQTVLTDDPERLNKCRALVLPGVGAFGSAMDKLKEKGLLDFLKEQQQKGVYMLGICLGLQVFFEHSEEDPNYDGIGFLPGQVTRFPSGLKVPHMGWSSIIIEKTDPLFEKIPNGSYFYFAHSYYTLPAENREIETIARCTYAVDFCAAVKKDNIYGLQFHPEKSGKIGLKVLENFGRMVLHGNHSGN